MNRSGIQLILAFAPVLSAQPYIFTPLTVPVPGASTFALGINHLGEIVGRYAVGTPVALNHGFILRNRTYTTIDALGADDTAVNGINNGGDVVGFYQSASQNHGFILQGPFFFTIDFPGANPAINGGASGINNHVDIVGNYADNDQRTHGYIRVRDKYTAVDFPIAGVLNTAALGINDHGHIVGIYVPTSGGTHGFLKDGAGFHAIDFPGAVTTAAAGINNKGEIVGSYQDSTNAQHGFVLSKGVYTRIDASFPGVTVTSTTVNGINDLGWIVGSCLSNLGPMNLSTGFLAKP